MKCTCLSFTLCLFILFSCTHHRYPTSLVAVDSLCAVRPDSALALLEQMDSTMQTARKADRMYYQLLLADAMNKAYVDIKSDSILKEVVHYYDRHGSANERMRAHYLLGCTYRDMGEAPMALQCYQDAVECADTTKNVCDYKLLCRIYSQMSSLFHRQYLPKNEISEIWKAYRYALMDADSITALRCYEHLSNAYFQLHIPDSTLYYSLRSAEGYKSIGDTASANSALAPAIYIYLQRGEYNKAEQMLSEVSKQSNMFNSLNSRASTYYNYMGLLSLGKKDYNSAKHYLYEALYHGHNDEDLEFSCQNLYRLYRSIGNADSIAKYTELYSELNDSSVARMSTASVAQMQSLYNYSRTQQIAEKTKREKQKLNLQNQLLIVTLLALISFGIAIVSSIRNRKNRIIRENIQEIEQLKVTIDNLVKESSQDEDDDLKGFEESDVYKSLTENASDMKKAGFSQLNELRKTANRLLPHFMYKLQHNEYELSSNELNLCILVKAEFRPSEIAILLNMTSQSISNLRYRLNKKLFNTDKGAKNFDEKITSL